MPQAGVRWVWIPVPAQFTSSPGDDMTNSWEVSLGDFLEDAVRARPDATFMEMLGQSYSYEKFYDEVMRAAGMYLSLGVKHGDRVCVVLPNCPEVLFSWFGLSVIGAIVIPINTAYKRDELAYIYNNSEAVALVAHTEFLEAAGAAADLAPSITIRICVGGSTENWLKFQQACDQSEKLETRPKISPSDISALVYTSGTTGSPKGVMITHAMYVAAGQGFALWTGSTSEDRFFTCLPFFHANTHYYSTMGTLAARGTLVVVERFSASRFWQQVRDTKATVVNFIGMMLTVLAKQPPSDNDRNHTARLFYGTPAFAPDILDRFGERFGATLIIGFGMTETCFGTVERLGDGRRAFSSGLPRRHPDPQFTNEVRAVDENGKDVAVRTPGELIIRNPAVTPGYWANEKGTAEALRNGWLYTGDMVSLDADGHLYYIDRKKDVIRRRGENISSQEVEDVLKRHPKILDCAVLAVPSDLGEDDVKAYVILVKGEHLEPMEIIDWCSENLAEFKVPRYIEMRDTFPRTPSLRVQKGELKTQSSDLTKDCFDREVAKHQ
jgi:crotonobetaine/carnitine-CoA ligase